MNRRGFLGAILAAAAAPAFVRAGSLMKLYVPRPLGYIYDVEPLIPISNEIIEITRVWMSGRQVWPAVGSMIDIAVAGEAPKRGMVTAMRQLDDGDGLLLPNIEIEVRNTLEGDIFSTERRGEWQRNRS